MTMATETENNGPESKEIKDVKEMKEALKDDAPPDNKQEEKDTAKKDEAAGKKDDDAAAAAAAGGANAAPAKASTVHHPDYEKDVVYLYQFPRTPLLPSLSPYGLKVETWLRLNGIKYEVSVSPFSPVASFSILFSFIAKPPSRPSEPARVLLSVDRFFSHGRACLSVCNPAARKDRFLLRSLCAANERQPRTPSLAARSLRITESSG